LARRLGKAKFFPFETPREIFEELREASRGGHADYYGITYEKIDAQMGVFWPCPTLDHPGTPHLMQDGISFFPDGKCRFQVAEWRESGDPVTNVLIDGMDATDPVFGYSPAGASGFFLGLNELAEVRVLTQTFDAEYGGHGGAVIAMTTKSGTSQFHGSLWESYRGASLDAKNYFGLGANPIPQFVRNQFGAGIGGPLKRNRTFFFANYEGFREVQASTAIATVPDALAHQGLLPSAGNPSACTNANRSGCVAIPINPLIQPFLNLMPPSNGPENGDGTGELNTANKGSTREDHGMVRIDHHFSNAHSLFARYTVDDSSALVPYVGTPPGTYLPGSRLFTWRGINMALFRTAPYSETVGAMSCALVSTGQPHLPRSTIRIRVCLFPCFLTGRSG
jgi:hypothetical protein